MKNLSLKNRSNYSTKQTFHCHMMYLSRIISARWSNTYMYVHLHTLQLIVQNYVISVFFCFFFAQQYFQNSNDWRKHWNKLKVMHPDLLDLMGIPPSWNQIFTIRIIKATPVKYDFKINNKRQNNTNCHT